MSPADHPRAPFSLRKLWLDVHLWIGAGLFVLLIPLSVSGALLVWRDGLDRLSHPDRYAVSGRPASLNPSAYLDKAVAVLPLQAKPARISLPASGHDPVVVAARSRAGTGRRPTMINVWLEPSDGRVLASGPGVSGAIGWLHEFHERLQIPAIGRQVVGWLGIAMLVNCLTGLWLWWPRRGSVVRGLRWGRSTSINYNLHHLVGFWVAIPLAVLSATGAYIAFPRGQGGAPRAGEARRAEDPDRPHVGSDHHGGARQIDQVVAVVLAASPGSRLISVTLPSRERDAAWQVEVTGPRGGRQTVRVSDSDGALVPATATGRGDPLMRVMHQVHEGHGAALWWRLVMTLAGLAPAILGVTGVVVWLRRKRIVGAAG